MIDLGCAPGGWAQIAADRVGQGVDKGWWLALIFRTWSRWRGLSFEIDFLDDSAPEKVLALAGRRADAVISDMARP